MHTALNQRRDRSRDRTVVFFTDGFIGNESQVLQAMHRGLDDARVFSFGIGASPNRFLMHRMAKLGNGAAAFITTGDNLRDGKRHVNETMDRFMQRIAHPAMTDIRIDWGGLVVADVYPRRIPDLFAGRPITLTGRLGGMYAHYGSGQPQPVRVIGRVGDRQLEITIPITVITPRQRISAIDKVWARMKVADLYDDALLWGKHINRQQVTNLALEHALMSVYTAFVAVDPTYRTSGSHGTTVHQPVPVPSGTRYDTTVPE
jgi:Ca-activated chloride channel family protein